MVTRLLVCRDIKANITLQKQEGWGEEANPPESQPKINLSLGSGGGAGQTDIPGPPRDGPFDQGPFTLQDWVGGEGLAEAGGKFERHALVRLGRKSHIRSQAGRAVALPGALAQQKQPWRAREPQTWTLPPTQPDKCIKSRFYSSS